MASRSSVDQLGGARQEPRQEQTQYAKVKPDGTEQLEDNRANAASRGRPDAKSVQTAMVSSLEVAENFVPNDAEQEEAIVHHALVGAVNSKANLANSQDGGDEILWGIMLPWIKDHGASWNWFKVYYASFVAYNNGDFERSSMLKKKADAVQRELLHWMQRTWSGSWIPGAAAFARDRMAEMKAAGADRDAAAEDGHATHAAMATESFVQTDEEKQVQRRQKSQHG